MFSKEGMPDPLEVRRDALLKRVLILRSHPAVVPEALEWLSVIANTIQDFQKEETIAKAEERLSKLEEKFPFPK